MAATHLLCRSNAGPMALVCLIGLGSVGCRTTWQSARNSDPSFDRLIEIEKKADPGKRSRRPLVSKMRPGQTANSKGQFAQSQNPSDSRRPDVAPALDNDAEFQEAFAEASPVEKALLERFGNALAQKSSGIRNDGDRPNQRSISDAPNESSSSRRKRSDPNEMVAAFSLSDLPEQDQGDLEPAREHSAPSRLEHMAVGTRNNGDGAAGNHLGKSDSEAIPDYESTVRPDTSSRHTNVQLASHSEPVGEERNVEDQVDSLRYRELGYAMISKLESQVSSTANPDERLDLAKKMRLIHLALDDLDAAEDPIEGLPPEEQSYFRHTIHGLHDATDINGNPVVSRRLTLALQSHRKAERSLERLANLEVINLAFCTEVDSFGVVTKFPQYDFRPDQAVLLYCELENFVSESKRGGYETQLQGSYEILDSDGRRVADQLLPEDSDVCGNMRRDFYIAYRLHMPDKIEPGRYQMKLTIEDMKGHKFGQSSIDFQIIR